MFCISLIILSKGLGKTLRNWIQICIVNDFITVIFPIKPDPNKSMNLTMFLFSSTFSLQFIAVLSSVKRS